MFNGDVQVNGTGTFSKVCLGGVCQPAWPAGSVSLWSTGTNGISSLSGVGIGVAASNLYALTVNGDTLLNGTLSA